MNRQFAIQPQGHQDTSNEKSRTGHENYNILPRQYTREVFLVIYDVLGVIGHI